MKFNDVLKYTGAIAKKPIEKVQSKVSKFKAGYNTEMKNDSSNTAVNDNSVSVNLGVKLAKAVKIFKDWKDFGGGTFNDIENILKDQKFKTNLAKLAEEHKKGIPRTRGVSYKVIEISLKQLDKIKNEKNLENRKKFYKIFLHNLKLVRDLEFDNLKEEALSTTMKHPVLQRLNKKGIQMVLLPPDVNTLPDVHGLPSGFVAYGRGGWKKDMATGQLQAGTLYVDGGYQGSKEGHRSGYGGFYWGVRKKQTEDGKATVIEVKQARAGVDAYINKFKVDVINAISRLI